MLKFAHLADVHLGFHKDDVLFVEECRVFDKIIDDCIDQQVDFIILAGDIFHTNISEMRVQKHAFAAFRKIQDAGIPVYAVYGSHDFSPVSNSVIDLLESSGFLTKMPHKTGTNGEIILEYIKGPKDSILTGLAGLKVGKDIEWYQNLNVGTIPEGKKIFLFHGGISEFTEGQEMDGLMPSRLLPAGFEYYAGGHLHEYKQMNFEDRPNVTYPGTPFAGNTADIEQNARGMERGYALVEWDDKPITKFVKVDNLQYKLISINCKYRTMDVINEEILNKLINVENKIVFIKLYGKIEKSDVALDVAGINEKTKGAIWHKLIKSYTEEGDDIEKGQVVSSIEEIEDKILDEREKGLLRIFKTPRMEDEKMSQYADRIEEEALIYEGLKCI